ncbi:response regulator [Shewanella salipaludis]|uniref:Sensory/regulatory protein RpfC n=1 Tax=Shewanella salipaludis TaxID=2723052 RepID=A0A972G3Z5_9GAMM|nr:response regulator [Shewanella salipaludis]NMH64005.1 response regulator [Shewanella salipaludis]
MSLLSGHKRALTWSVLTLLLGLGASALVASMVQENNLRVTQAALQALSERVADRLSQRLSSYPYGLRAVRSSVLAAGTDGIDPARFHRDSLAWEFANGFPGAAGFGFIRRVGPEAEAGFLARMRAAAWPGSGPGSGPEFALHQLSPHQAERYLIEYVEPLARNRAALGLDIASHAASRAAAKAALASGEVRLSAAIPAALAPAFGGPQHSFLLLMPVYAGGITPETAAARELAGLGWSYARLPADEMLAELAPANTRLVLTDVTDVTDVTAVAAVTDTATVDAPQPFFASHADTGNEASAHEVSVHEVTLARNLFGRQWRLSLTPTPEAMAALPLPSVAVIWLSGLLLSALSAAWVWWAIGNRQHRHPLCGPAQLEESKQGALLGHVLNAGSEVSIIATDVDGMITLFNRGAEKLLGYRADEMVGKSTPAPLHLAEEIQARALQLTEEYAEPVEGFEVFVYKARTEGPETRAWTYVRKDGSQCQVSLSVTAMRDERNSLLGYLGIGVNIDVLLQQQAALESASQQLRKAAEVAELGIWTWTLADNRVEWNERMFAMYEQPLSLREQGLDYEHWRMRVHPDDIAATEAKLIAAVEGRGVYDPVFRIVTPGGVIRHIQAGAQVERDKQGKTLKVMGINLDITEQCHLEESLRYAKCQADEASAAKSAFLANMSHEIRTPMNAVLGMLQLIQHTQMTEQQQDYVAKSQTAAKSLLRLLNDVLDFSKIDAGKLELDSQPCAIENIMRDLAVILSGNQSNPGSVEVIFDLDASIPAYLKADQLRLQQVLINLASNAIKFTQRGHVIVSIQCLSRDAAQASLRMAVTDTGIGIAAAEQEKIFSGFVQAESSTSRRYGGTGLGLAITKRLVELMGGELHLCSQVGSGSCFWFDINLPIIANDTGVQPISLSGQRILVVDDNATMQEILHKNLLRLGCEVESATNGRQAIARVEAAAVQGKAFDLVLMDWHMPDLNGLETADIISNSLNSGEPPVIVMLTAYGHEALSESHSFESCPFVHFLTKPVTSQLLAESIRDVICGTLLNTRGRAPRPDIPRQLMGLEILVVEDNQLNRQVIYELLTHAGAHVVLACGGGEGVAKVLEAEMSFDLVIMDVQMPDLDGLEATRRIRADGRFAALPILAMTANVSASDHELCIQAGMNAHVGKPIDMALLLPAILTLTNRPHRAANPGRAAVPRSLGADTGTAGGALMEPLETILDRFAGDAALFNDIIPNFEPEMVTQLGLFRHAIATGDYSAAAAVSHAIKGVASNFGASRLTAHAACLEEALQQPSVEPAELALRESELAALIDKSVQALVALSTSVAHTVAASNRPDSQQVMQEVIEEITQEAMPGAAANELGALVELLALQNLEALALVNRLETRLAYHRLWPELKAQVDGFNFSGALETAQFMLKEML